MVSLDKYSGRCNLSTKIFVPSKSKDVNVKAFNIITRIKEAQIMPQHFSCDQIINGKIKHANVNVRTIVRAKKILVPKRS